MDEIRATEIDGSSFSMANFFFTLASCSGGNAEARCRCFGFSRETEVTISVFLCWQGVGHATTVKGGAMDKPKVDVPNFRTGQVSLRWGTLCMLVLYQVYDSVSTFISEGWNHINSVIIRALCPEINLGLCFVQILCCQIKVVSVCGFVALMCFGHDVFAYCCHIIYILFI